MPKRWPISKVEAVFGSHCNERNLVNVKFPKVGTWRVHKKVAYQLGKALAQLSKSRLVDIRDTRGSGGTYVCRKVKLVSGGSGKEWSRHAYGIAVDINPSALWYGAHASDLSRSQRQRHSRIAKIMNRWGYFNPVDHDLMHFEPYQLVSNSVWYTVIRGFSRGLAYSYEHILERKHGAPYPSKYVDAAGPGDHIDLYLGPFNRRTAWFVWARCRAPKPLGLGLAPAKVAIVNHIG